MQENHYLVPGDGTTRIGIEEQNNDDIFDETNDTIDDDDKA